MGGKHAHPCHREWYWQTGDPLRCWKSLDWPSVRRGRQVYTEVFAPCHSLKGLTFNHLQAIMTKEELKKLANSYTITDKFPNSEGLYDQRPCKTYDELPQPYPNSKAAEFANGGAEPPDLRSMVRAREDGCDYVFALMTGYGWKDLVGYPPWMNELKSGQFFNPYMKGCVIAMPPPLSDGMIDYEDGTPATVSQMAKDVVHFLRWTHEPEYDERRTVFWKCWISVTILFALTGHMMQKWASWKIYGRIRYQYWNALGPGK